MIHSSIRVTPALCSIGTLGIASHSICRDEHGLTAMDRSANINHRTKLKRSHICLLVFVANTCSSAVYHISNDSYSKCTGAEARKRN